MSANVSDLVGQSIAGGRYEITGHIGTGSMGHVYKAFDRRLETTVCVKIPTSSRLDDPDFYRRFEMESRFLVRLAHPQVVKIIDVGKEDNLPYIVMQYVGGGSLLDRMTDANGQPHPRPMRDLKHWLPAVSRALDFMHKEGCIHRDVKPANILFDDHNNAFLSDFGLSKILLEDEEPAAEANRMTAKGAVVGTPNYVAPEIVLAHEYNGKADQYSLATTVYEFLTGKAPMEGPSASATMVNQTTRQPPPLMKFVPSIPEELSAVVLKALSKKHINRYPTCEDFSDAVLATVLTASGSRMAASGRSTVTGGSSTVLPKVPKFLVTKVSRARTPGKIACPRCAKVLVLNPDYGGLVATCSGCQSRLKISQDLNELGLLERNPNYDSNVHKFTKEEHDSEVQTILTPEVFGKKLTEQQALLMVGGTMLAIIIGAVAFSLGLFTPSTKQQTKLGVRSTNREGDAVRMVEATKVPIELVYPRSGMEGDWLAERLGVFRRSVVGQTTELNVRELGESESLTGAVEIAATEGRPLPALSAPQHTIASSLLNAAWQKHHPEQPLYAVEETLYFTPLVALVWQDRFFEFKKKYPALSIPNLIDASLNQADWNAIAGKPEWGLFHFAAPRLDDPLVGPMLQLMVAQQAIGRNTELTEADVTRPEVRELLTQFHRVPVKPAAGSANGMRELLTRAIETGPRLADVLIVTEQEALRALPELEQKWGFMKIVYMDPAPVFKKTMGIASTATGKEREAAAAFLNYLKSSEAQQDLLESTLRPSNHDISVMSGDSLFSRYTLRGVVNSLPEPSPIPDSEVLNTLQIISERIQMQ